MAPQTGPITVTDPILRILWNLLLDPQRRKARIRLQFIFGHCGVAKNEACDKENKTASDLPQRTGRWIPDVVALAKRQIHSQLPKPSTHRSSIMGHWNPTRNDPSLGREGGGRQPQLVFALAHLTATAGCFEPCGPPREIHPGGVTPKGPPPPLKKSRVETAAANAEAAPLRYRGPADCPEGQTGFSCRASVVTHMGKKRESTEDQPRGKPTIPLLRGRRTSRQNPPLPSPQHQGPNAQHRRRDPSPIAKKRRGEFACHPCAASRKAQRGLTRHLRHFHRQQYQSAERKGTRGVKRTLQNRLSNANAVGSEPLMMWGCSPAPVLGIVPHKRRHAQWHHDPNCAARYARRSFAMLGKWRPT
ncbi:Tbingi protein [Trypanosoma grayi]|uniref:Tbingi protein n=1 Tax=Trypanosoma grayi TaxID=71804 RepID=UPI0004F487FC|nr:Tbingi protein [Trypanosoma grayi]KEG13099.1 Tbingi protein [Trypanosoma grayi]